MTIELIAGARPNFMKIAPIARALRDRDLPFRIVHTGQHYDDAMSAVFFEQLRIPEPEVRLSVGSDTHGAQTGRILMTYEGHLLGLQTRPQGVVVVGDVNSTAACTLVAVKLGIPVAHVEAGLRSFDRSMPEEINRLVTDAICDLLLVSEPSGEKNLRHEGVAEHRIHYVGNVMIDTLVDQLEGARSLSPVELFQLDPGRRYAYVTLHRPANVDSPERLVGLVGLLEQVSESLDVVFTVHPRTRARLESGGLLPRLERTATIRACPPLGYRENLAAIAGASVILTDSGGVQEESSYLGVPCLTLRPNTERPVTVDLGTNTIVGDDFELALRMVRAVAEGVYKRGSPIPGWDGRAATRIADILGRAWA